MSTWKTEMITIVQCALVRVIRLCLLMINTDGHWTGDALHQLKKYYMKIVK